MSENCKYCELPENKQKHPGLVCESCNRFVHLACLRRLGTPGDFTCDVFFDFTCETCSPTNKELFVRTKFPWVNAIVLTLHHLNTKSYGISNHGYFHYKTHICSFIDRNWHLLFGSQFKQKKNWVGTIAGALSIYSGLFFRSGSVALGESGWWSLMHFFSPAVAAHIVQELAKTKGRPRNQTSLDRYHFLDKAIELGYKDLINEEVATPVQNPPQTKKRKLEWSVADAGYCDSFYPTEAAEELSLELREVGAGLAGAEGAGQGGAGSLFPLAAGAAADPALHTQSDSSSIHSYQQSALYYDSDSYSRSPRSPRSPRAPPDARAPPPDARDPPPDPPTDPPPDDTDKATDKKDKNKRPKDKPVVKRDSLFSSELNSLDLPWVEKREEESTDLVEMTPYEEIQLLKQVESLVQKVRDPAKRTYLVRLRAKLALRRLKRHKHLPLFDLDKTVRRLAGAAGADRRPAAGGERVLDRFQRSYVLDSLCGTIQSSTLGVQLLPALEPTAARSPHSGVLLKPFIRRDCHTAPPWLALMDQLLRRTNRHIKDYSPPPRACIEYSYVKPQHIPAVNNLCAQYFWPGIDLSEALQYPEFSCVVTYKKLVVGCAFLVPDVAPSASYVSFLLTRPEWRRAKIASFMLYHLLQTCTGKDVTLHVSPTNPAIFLYQKFGFKVEELIQDFYEKYFDIDYKGCRHALFLRLVR